MGLFKKIKKAAKKVGKSVGKTTKKVGGQIKRSAAVAAPALLGPGLGTKVAVGLAHGNKSALKGAGRVANVTGRGVQIVGTALATYFGGAVAGAAAYRGTALLRQIDQKAIRDARYKAGGVSSSGRTIKWKKHAVRTVSTVAAAYMGAGAMAAAAGGKFATGGFQSGQSILGKLGGGGQPNVQDYGAEAGGSQYDAEQAAAGAPSSWYDDWGKYGTQILGGVLTPSPDKKVPGSEGGFFDMLGGGGEAGAGGAGGEAGGGGEGGMAGTGGEAGGGLGLGILPIVAVGALAVLFIMRKGKK